MKLTPIVIFLICPSLVIFNTLAPKARAEDKSLIRELWVGEFTQTKPMPWHGRMELFLRYTSAKGPIQGVITWPGLSGSRSELTGTRNGSTIRFSEVRCLENCGQAVMGGKYQGSFDDQYQNLTGTSELKKLGLKGNFKLKRLMLPDE